MWRPTSSPSPAASNEDLPAGPPGSAHEWRKRLAELPEKFGEACEIGGLVVVERHMTAVGGQQFAVRQLLGHGCHIGRVHRVIFARDYQRRHVDALQVGEAVP